MKVLFNPRENKSFDIQFRPEGDAVGYKYSMLANETAKCENQVAEFLLDRYPNLKDVTKEYKNKEDIGKVKEITKEETVNLFEKNRVANDEDLDTSGPGFYGPGLEDDGKPAGWTVPRSGLRSRPAEL